jgi:hypothetical protein
MPDAPPLRPFVLKPDHLKGLRWSMERARDRGDLLYRIDLPMLEALVDRTDASLDPAGAYWRLPPPQRKDRPVGFIFKVAGLLLGGLTLLILAFWLLAMWGPAHG